MVEEVPVIVTCQLAVPHNTVVVAEVLVLPLIFQLVEMVERFGVVIQEFPLIMEHQDQPLADGFVEAALEEGQDKFKVEVQEVAVRLDFQIHSHLFLLLMLLQCRKSVLMVVGVQDKLEINLTQVLVILIPMVPMGS